MEKFQEDVKKLLLYVGVKDVRTSSRRVLWQSFRKM